MSNLITEKSNLQNSIADKGGDGSAGQRRVGESHDNDQVISRKSL